MSIDKIMLNARPIEKIFKPTESQATTDSIKGEVNKAPKEGFASMLSDAMQEVNTLQHNADNQIEGLILGSDNVSPHGAMLAIEKADMAFQMMNSIRSKIIRAYEEVIRTQV